MYSLPLHSVHVIPTLWNIVPIRRLATWHDLNEEVNFPIGNRLQINIIIIIKKFIKQTVDKFPKNSTYNLGRNMQSLFL